jgi:L-ascorbate metabolism protein UlaG (beta-lactamase superfamily)
VFIDAFWEAKPLFMSGQSKPDTPALPAEAILVTHAHWDHFDPQLVAEASARTGAVVAGPEDVIEKLRRALPDKSLAVLEPPPNRPGEPAASTVLKLPHGSVTAFRTFHGRRHNSYLVQLGRWSFFHDGDNENTRPLDLAALGQVDALLLCPWQGANWAEFVARLAPKKWVLIHLSAEEIEEHRAGRFLSQLPDYEPRADRALALRPGETLVID